MRNLVLLIILFFASNNMFSQNYEYIRRGYNSKNRTTSNNYRNYFNNRNIIYVSEFSDDSSSFDTLVMRSKSNNKISYIVCDSNGIIQNHFMHEGCTLGSIVFPKKKNYFYTTINAAQYLYVNGNKILDSIGKSNTGFRVIKCGFDGSINLLETIYAYGNYKLIYDDEKERLHLVLSQIQKIDINKHDTSIIHQNKVNILQISTDGAGIQKVFVLDSVFSKFSIDNDKLFCYSNLSNTNYNYEINRQNYYRNNSSDKYTTDVVFAAYDLNTSEYLWNHVYKVYLGGKIVAADVGGNNFCLALDYLDTVIMDGVFNRIDSVQTSQKVIISYNLDGSIKWLKTFNYNVNTLPIFDVNLNKLCMELGCISAHSLSYDGKQLGYDTDKANHMFVDLNNGSLLNIYPRFIGLSVCFTPNDNVYYGIHNFSLNSVDTITISRELYKARIGVQDYLFFKFNGNIKSVINEARELTLKFKIYPNPCSDKLHLSAKNAVNFDDISLFDLAGKQISMLPIKEADNAVSLDMSGIQTGIYILRMDGNSYKIVRQ